jgi:Alpha/beta hydrolase family
LGWDHRLDSQSSCWILKVTAGTLAIAFAAISPSIAVSFSSPKKVTCSNHTQTGFIPGKIVTGGRPLPYTLVGELCSTPSELENGSTIQLLIHGATYSRFYWDLPGTFDGVTYSYSRAAAQAGYATFAVSLIGTADDVLNRAGQSPPPPSNQVTLDVAAFVVHQLTQALKGRRGAPPIAGTPHLPHFDRVIEVGHSFGSIAIWQESTTYGDAEGLIITGAVHHVSTAAVASTPANQDPKFARLGLDSGYTTVALPSRAGFYNQAAADPAVISADNANRDLFSSAEIPASVGLLTSTATRAIKVPVLVIMGAKDTPFCGPDAQGVTVDCTSGSAIVHHEAPDYSPAAQLQACAIPNSGHAISLHLPPASQQQVVDAVAWANAFIGQNDQRLQPAAKLRWPPSTDCSL